MLKQLAIFLLFCLRLTVSHGQDVVNYQQLPAFPGTARDDASAFISNGNIYMVGGFDVNFNTRNDVWKYNPSIASWVQMADFPGAGRQYARTLYVNQKPCIIGGIDGSGADLADCWCFNTSSSTWETSPYPNASARRQHVTASLPGKAFFGLGINNSTVCKDWWVYSNGQWQQAVDFPGTARKEAVAGTWGGSVYAGMGIDASNTFCYKDFYRFDPITGHWTRLADYPGHVCEYAAMVEVSDGLLVLMGINEQFAFSREVYLYKPDEDRWTRLNDYPYYAKKGVALAVQGNTFYMACGVDETIVRTNDLVKGDYVSANNEVLTFPNPFTDVLRIKAAHNFAYTLYSASGAIVAKDHAAAGLNELSFPWLEKGLYFLVISQSDGSVIKRKLIKD